MTIPFEYVNDDYCDCRGENHHRSLFKAMFILIQMEVMNREHRLVRMDDSSVKIKVMLELSFLRILLVMVFVVRHRSILKAFDSVIDSRLL